MYKTWSYVLFHQKLNMEVYGLNFFYIKNNIIAYNPAKDDLIPISIRKVIRPRKSRKIASKSFFV